MNTTKGHTMTPTELLASMRAKAAHRAPVDWDRVRRVSSLPISERSEADQDLVDAYGTH